MKASWIVILGLAGLGLDGAYAQVKNSPVTPEKETEAPLFPATIKDLNSFELALPLALDWNLIHGGRAYDRMLAPSLGFYRNQIQLGVRTPVGIKETDISGAILGFAYYHFPWRQDSRSAFLAGGQVGYADFNREASWRIGFTLGRMFVIGSTDYPGAVRLQLNVLEDFPRRSQSRTIFSLGLSLGVIL